MTTPLHYRPITELAAQLRSGDVTAVELVDHFIDRIDHLNDRLHAMITVATDQARAAAEEADIRFKAGVDQPPLAGIPITFKDVIATKGIRTTGNSPRHANWVPDHEPVVVTKLRDAGAIILGKTNTNEGGGIPSANDLYPPPRSPWNTDHVCIGSSSGPNAVMAAGLSSASIGTDSAGSVRLPAGQAGVVGLKASNGRISTWGQTNSPVGAIGPFARTAADTALLLEVMAGHVSDDPRSLPLPVPAYTSQLETDMRGMRLGVPRTYIDTDYAEDEVKRAFDDELETFAKMGMEIVDIPLKGMAEARMAVFVVMYADAHTAKSAALKSEGFGYSARLYATHGAFLSAADYINAQELGYRVRAEIESAFANVDVIAMPTSPFVTAEAARRPGQHRMGINTIFTAPFNLTGHPAISIPGGFSASTGIPIGLQLIGKQYDELSLLQVAHAHEHVTTWHTMHPEL